MTPILTAANMIDGTNAVKSKSTQKSELNQAFGQEFSRALANTKSQKQNAEATRSAPNNTNATNKAQTYRNNQEGTTSAGKLRDNDVQVNPLKPDTEKSEVASTGKLAADTNDKSLPVRKKNDDEATASGDVSAMLLALQWMHADPVKPPSGDETKNNIDPGTAVTADPLPPASPSKMNIGADPGVQVTADPLKQSADPAVSFGTDPGTQVTADPKSDARNRLDNTVDRHRSLRNDDAKTTSQGSALISNSNQGQSISGQSPAQPAQAQSSFTSPELNQQQNKLAEQAAPTATTNIPIQTNSNLQAEVVRAFTNASGTESSAQKKAADRSAAQSADIALKRQSDAEKTAGTEAQAAVKAEAAPTPLENKFRTMLDEFRVPKTGVNSRSGDATTDSAANTIRSFGDAIRTSEPFQTASQQIMQPNRIPLKVGNDGWNTAIGQHMLRMSAEQMKTAELELNPPELGPLKVVLDLQSDQLSTTFVTGSAQVQQALEASVPRLQEMMSQAGYQLNQVNVQTAFSDGQREAQQQAQAQFTSATRQNGSASVNSDSNGSAPDIAVQRAQNQRQGGVDMFV